MDSLGVRWCRCSLYGEARVYEAVLMIGGCSVFFTTYCTRRHATSHSNAAFTLDTCSPDTSCIYLYPFISSVGVYMYPVSATKLSLRQHVSTCIRIQVARPGYLYPAICIWCKRSLIQHMRQWRHPSINLLCSAIVWHGGVVVMASDLQPIGRRFESWPLRFT